MTSKEAVKLARIEFEKDLEYDENNQWLKNLIPALEQTEKDLEVLEILRKIFKLDLFIYSRDEIDNNIECAGKQIYHLAKTCAGDDLAFNNQQDILKLKEWYESDK